MKKQIVFSSPDELSVMRRDILAQMDETSVQIRTRFLNDTGCSVLKAFKFEKVVTDRVFGERLNFIEYLNQTLTYLVCVYAGSDIFKRFSPQNVTINFGTQPGYDILTPEGIIGECFAVSSVKSNDKLKKDVLRLQQDHRANHKFVYFYSDSFDRECAYVERITFQYPDVQLNSLSFAQLTTRDL